MINLSLVGRLLSPAFCMFALCLAGSVEPLRADSLVVGHDNGVANSFPFSGGVYRGEYQQLYSRAAFDGPIVLKGISFSTSPDFAGMADLLNVQISLSTVSTNSLSNNFGANLGRDNTGVFARSFNFNPTSNGTFDLNFAIDPFLYNPGQGNLLIDLNVSGGNGFNAFRGTTEGVLGRVYQSGGSGQATVQTNYGLLTQFDFDRVKATAAVPEPGSVLLCLPGLALAFVLRRRR